MKPLDWVAFGVLTIQAPIPFFWLLFHPFVEYWRRRPRLVFKTVGPLAWLSVAAFLLANRKVLFSSVSAPDWMVVLGLVLIILDLSLIAWIHQTLGTHRLVGAAEIDSRLELITTGPYAFVRHPRYSGMIASVIGASLIAASPFLWLFLAVWLFFALIAIRWEEREMLERFGPAFAQYAGRVPRLLPFPRPRTEPPRFR